MGTSVKEAEPAPQEARPDGGRGMTLLKLVGTVVTVVSGIVGLVFLLLPQLKPEGPPQNQQANLSKPRVEPNISRAQYLRRTDDELAGFTKKELAVRGAFIELRVEIVGYKGKLLVLKWELIDASNGNQLHDERSDGFIAPANEGAVTQRLFVPLPRRPGTFFVRIELLREGKYGPIPLASTRTERFPGLA